MLETLSQIGSRAARAGTDLARALLPGHSGNRPPMLDGGIPYVGHVVQFNRVPLDLLARGFREHGDVFGVQLLGRHVAVMIGARANEAVFRAPDDQLSAREVYRFTVPVFGKGMVYDAEPEIMAEQMGFLMPALRDKAMRTYAEVMTEEVEQYVDALADEGELEMVSMFTELATYMAARALLGLEFRQQLDSHLTGLFHDLERGMNQIAFFFPHLPLPVFRRRDAARAEVVKLIGEIVERRRHAETEHVDMIQALMDARYRASGRALTHDELTGMVLAIAFAGHHNSAVTAAWSTVEMLRHPHTIRPLLAEQQQVHGEDGEISFESLKKCHALENMIQETGRLHPPLIMLMRAVLRDFEFDDYRIPAGDMVMVSPAISHRDARSFEDPDRFDPDRFAPPREEHKKPHALITFGGGRHRCIGMHLALMLQKALWSVLFRRVEFELLDAAYEPDFSGFVVGPRPPARIRYRKTRTPYAHLGS